jgi:hypothetical protein
MRILSIAVLSKIRQQVIKNMSEPTQKITLRDGRATKVLELPSLKGSKIEVWPSLLVRDLSKVDVSDTNQKQGLSALPLHIKSWNLSAEDGSDLPITADSIGQLSVDDGVYLMTEITKFSAEQKKS